MKRFLKIAFGITAVALVAGCMQATDPSEAPEYEMRALSGPIDRGGIRISGGGGSLYYAMAFFDHEAGSLICGAYTYRGRHMNTFSRQIMADGVVEVTSGPDAGKKIINNFKYFTKLPYSTFQTSQPVRCKLVPEKVTVLNTKSFIDGSIVRR